MNTEDHATPPPIVTLVSENKSYDDSIGSPQLSGGEIIGKMEHLLDLYHMNHLLRNHQRDLQKDHS